jgi:hypothetical protein
MFRIEFDGKILPGFEPQIVRLEVAVRLRLRDVQVERLFSGRTVILKKQVRAGNSAAYLNELRSMGLDARLVPVGEQVDTPLTGPCKAVFWGRTLPDFNRTAVMTAAVRKLRVSPAQLKQIFSGVKVVLKRRLDVDDGRMFIAEMAGIGMQVELEPDELPQPLPEPAPEAAAPAARPEASPDAQAEDAAFGALLTTACDLSGTPFAGYDTSSDFAADDGEETVMVMPPPAPVKRVLAREGFDAANQDGYLNCPHCGRYQPAAETCVSCGGVMPPQRKLYVGKAGSFIDNSPTTLVTPEHGRANRLHPGELPVRKPSLQEQLEQQMERPSPASRASRRILIVLVILAAGAAAAFFFLRH